MLRQWAEHQGSRFEAGCSWTSWHNFSSFLIDPEVPFVTRRMCFINLVYNTLISALEARVLSDAENDRLTRFLCSRARALLRGKAHSVDEEKTHCLDELQSA